MGVRVGRWEDRTVTAPRLSGQPRPRHHFKSGYPPPLGGLTHGDVVGCHVTYKRSPNTHWPRMVHSVVGHCIATRQRWRHDPRAPLPPPPRLSACCPSGTSCTSASLWECATCGATPRRPAGRTGCVEGSRRTRSQSRTGGSGRRRGPQRGRWRGRRARQCRPSGLASAAPSWPRGGAAPSWPRGGAAPCGGVASWQT